MPGISDFLPDALLAIMGLLGLIRIRRYADAFAATAALFGVEVEELYRDVELYIIERWQEEFAELDVHSRGLFHFVAEAAMRRPNELLLEAACRLKGAQLTIWDLERQRCDLYGHHGPMFTAAINGGQFVALIGQPLLPWYQTVAREAEPSTSSASEDWPSTAQAVQFGRNYLALTLQEEPSRNEVDVPHQESGGEVEEEPNERGPAEQQPEMAQWHEDPVDRYHGMLRPRSGAHARTERVPRTRAAKVQPDFKPADITALPSHMAAELVAPTTPPYVIRNNKILCRLPHCGVAEREFATVAAWKKHVALARSHLDDAFCGNCGHYLIMPPELDQANVKAFITAHKKERCIAASKATMRQRRAEVTRLDGLMRNASHIHVPVQPPSGQRKRRYDTEEARRADVCASFLKRFRAAEPQLMADIAYGHPRIRCVPARIAVALSNCRRFLLYLMFLCLSHGLRSFAAHIAHRPFRMMFTCLSAKNTQNTSPCTVQEILHTSFVVISLPLVLCRCAH
uniref:ANK_REP_REGION domain-containing protein n=1 Tax=Ascaris lumbricoides TaxID=6252 RepID=A0A0M3HWV8_ASCLU